MVISGMEKNKLGGGDKEYLCVGCYLNEDG